MKHPALVLLPVALLFASSLSAQVLGPGQVKTYKGKVLTAEAKGSVTASDRSNKSSRTLGERDLVDIKETVNVGDNSSSVLVFSNGATFSLEENTSLRIRKFLQDPYASPHTIAVDTAEPSTSYTILDFQRGKFTCQAKRLYIENGSSFLINTPVGTASIKGTIFSAEINEKQFILKVTEGLVEFRDINKKITQISAGHKLVINYRHVGGSDDIEITGDEFSRMFCSEYKQLNRDADQGKLTSDKFTFQPTNNNPLINPPLPIGRPTGNPNDLQPPVVNVVPPITNPNP